MKLCLQCRDFVGDAVGERCSVCQSELLDDEPEHRAKLIDLLVYPRLRELVDQWRAESIVKAGSARRLHEWVALRESEASLMLAALAPVAPEAPPEAPPDPAPVETPQPEAPAPLHDPAPIEPPPPPRRPRHAAHEDDAVGHAGSLFTSTDVTHGAVDAFVALDTPGAFSSDAHESEPDGPSRWETEVRPLLYENIGWFIGTLFVLAGSVYGVREAWRSLGGVPRHLLVAAAFMAYHAGFAGIARLLAPRSATTGRVLGGIALGLLPVVFVDLSSLTALNRTVGIVAALACAAVSAWTLRSVARRFESPGALASSVLPVLLAQVPMASLAPSSWGRVLLGAVGVASVAWAGHTSFPDDDDAPSTDPPRLHAVVAALYATAALLVFALTGASDTGSDLGQLSAGFSFVVAALASVIVLVAGRASAHRHFPRGANAVEVLALGALSVAALSAATTALRGAPTLAVQGVVASATALLATATFAQAARRHPGALHFVIPAASVGAALLTRALAPNPDLWWPAGTVLAACGGLFVARSLEGEHLDRARTILLRWSVAAGLALTAYALVGAVSSVPTAPWEAAALTSLLFGLSAHLAGAWRIRPLHLVGGLGTVIALAAAMQMHAWADVRVAWLVALTGAGVAYGVLAVPYEALAARWGRGSSFEVIDDLSRVALLGAAALGALAFQPVGGFVLPSRVGSPLDLDHGLFIAAAGAALLTRSLRDRSRYVGLVGALTLAFAAYIASGATTVAQRVLVAGGLTLTTALVATLLGFFDRTRYTRRDFEARRFLHGIVLPGRSAGVALVRDAFADAAIVGALLAALHVGLWISNWDNDSRPWAVQGGLLLIVACVASFLSPGFVDRRLRGATFTLFAAGAAVALTAVANRIGRPLPPPVIGLRLTLIAAGVWVLRQLAERYGPRLAAWLDRPSQGDGYKKVFSGAVVALAFVMAADAVLVGAPGADRALLVTPPLLLLGAALALALMARATRMPAYWLPAAGLIVPGAALLAAQRSLTGVTLVSVMAATAKWVPPGSAASADPWRWNDPLALMTAPEALDAVRARAVTGAVIVALVFAAVAAFIERSAEAARRWLSPLLGDASAENLRFLRGTMVVWSTVAGASVLAMSLWRGHLVAAVLVTLAGALLTRARARRAGVPIAVTGLMAAVHALATMQASVPWWAGAAWMALAAALLHAGPHIARRYEADPEDVYERAHPLALTVAVAAIPYALATGGAWTNNAAALDVLWNALTGLAGRWMTSPSLPVTFALAAWCAGVAALQWQDEDAEDSTAYACSAGAVMLAAFATWTGMTVAFVMSQAAVTAGAWTLPFARGWMALRTLGTPLVLASAVVAGVAHALARSAAPRADRKKVAGGTRWGRDAMLLAAVVWASLFAALARQGGVAAPPWALTVGVVGFTAGVLVAGHAAWTEGTARHVYFVQVAIVAVYGLVRTELARTLPPEADAVFGLVMGFLLVGVTVQARRAGIPPVAEATRRFAALLPFGIALVLPQEASASSAMIAAGSALLYGTLGYVERSRLFGSLGAAAGNLALLLFALAQGLQGVEIWLAPAGLFVLAISQIFGDSLARPSRMVLRVIGSLLLYLPAAMQIALQVGNARDGTYPVVFGLACLCGIAAGMMLHIRAYLALGVAFLVLDVVASLVHAGLRDHRVGFVLLSTAGLGILGVMVFITLKRDFVRAVMARWRTRMRGWD